MNVLSVIDEYAEVRAEARAFLEEVDPHDPSGNKRRFAILLLAQDYSVGRAADVLANLADQYVEARDMPFQPEPEIPTISRSEFTNRFVMAFISLVDEGGVALPGETIAAVYAGEAAGTYWNDATTRRVPPEECAQREITLIQES